jgi:hypothetical protein
MRCFNRLVVLCAILVAGTPSAAAENVLASAYVENWGFYQRNENGSGQWKYEPRLYIPFRLDSGATFTQRIDVPMIYTNDSGPGNPGGSWSGGFGDIFIEEILESRELAPDFRLRASVRFVFPTGKQSPFGASQYQWAPAGGFVYDMPDVLRGVTLAPYVRYFSGFDPRYDDVQEKRTLDLYPAVNFQLGAGWSLLLYPDNPITYNESNGTWFVPLDVMLARKLDPKLEFGVGGAWKLGNPSDPSYRYIIDARLIVYF